MSDSLPFYPSSSKSQEPTPRASLHTCEPRGTSCQQMADSETKDSGDVCLTQEDNSTLTLSRRHSADEAISPGSGSAPGRGHNDSDHFHLYHQQFSQGAVTATGRLQQSLSSFNCLQESSYPELPAVSVEPSCFLSQSFPPCRSSSSLQQVSTRLYPNNDQSNSSKYSLSSQSHQESSSQPLFPKPIYSYSILIFMALKNSKTGSLPVSEIYSFMTEHFPYFKTAPDGWKNSVRHNLSLNKCFVKVENKTGTSSRKGCLWALNPAKVEKMHDELHKWRRKDPIAVRRSMARPEWLERLLGEKPDKLRSLSSYTNPAWSSRLAPFYSDTSSSCTAAQLQPPCLSSHRLQYGYIQPQQPCFFAPAHPINSFSLYSACGQPAATGSVNSPMAAEMPPVYNAALQAEYSLGPRSMQDLLLEGDVSYDIDALNPSLTDLQLQGNLWEEVREDSLVLDAQVPTTTPSSISALQDHHNQTNCPQVMLPPVRRRKADYEDENTDCGRTIEHHGCLNGLHPVVYSGMENLAGYLTSCSTTISLV